MLINFLCDRGGNVVTDEDLWSVLLSTPAIQQGRLLIYSGETPFMSLHYGQDNLGSDGEETSLLRILFILTSEALKYLRDVSQFPSLSVEVELDKNVVGIIHFEENDVCRFTLFTPFLSRFLRQLDT